MLRCRGLSRRFCHITKDHQTKDKSYDNTNSNQKLFHISKNPPYQCICVWRIYDLFFVEQTARHAFYASMASSPFKASM